MIENIHSRDNLIGFARQQAKPFLTQKIHGADVDKALKDGWGNPKFSKNKKKARVSRKKTRPEELEGRVWALLYRMGFDMLSGQGGARIILSPENPESPKTENPFNCVAIDGEVALAIECRTAQEPQKDTEFQERLSKFSGLHKQFAQDVRKQFQSDIKRQIGMVMVVWDLIQSDINIQQALGQNVTIFDESDLSYYEELVKHLDVAAKYQFLADIFPGKPIPGLEIIVPALQTRIGNFTAYTFAIRPEYLLKIAFVSHRAKGGASDLNAYQRMVTKKRLQKIRKYISAEGSYFPTNVVLNMEKKKYIRFDLGKQEGGDEGARMGWLHLSPTYKSAYIIDGQHRLFAYSGHERASKSYLHVLAFDGLPGPLQAKLFVDINHEQKSVKTNLLAELWADLHWDSQDDEKRLQAVVSKAIQGLNENKESPLYGRILLSDKKSTERRCITLSSLLSALDTSFYLVHSKGNIIEYRALWAGDNETLLKRTMKIISGWLGFIANNASDWWNVGQGAGGGLATNNGVTICINVLKSVMDELEEKKNYKLIKLTDNELLDKLAPYGNALGKYLASKTAQDRAEFRTFIGGGGQNTGTKMCQEALCNAFSDFSPSGLAEYIAAKKNNNNEKGRELTDKIEKNLQNVILKRLKTKFTADPEAWWYKGVHEKIRTDISTQIELSGGKAGSREQNFQIIHYRKIAMDNWLLFDRILGYETGNKEKQTSWIHEVNLMRNIVNHPSRREFLTNEQLDKLRQYDTWLQQQVSRLANSTAQVS